MNIDKANEIIDFYIDNFDKTVGKEHDELFKWRCAWQCRKFWNIGSEDFSGMFQSCFRDSGNLISSSFWWPNNGIMMLCDEHSNHRETVREAFRDLTEDTGEDDKARGEHVFAFLHKINSLLESRSNGKGYLQNSRSALSYLGLIFPEKDFIYKPSTVSNFADSVEYPENFSSGKAFRLDIYYRMCRELSELLRNRTELMQIVQKELMRQAEEYDMPGLESIDPECHILAFDIMYIADAYDYYMDHPFVHRTKASRTKQEKEEKKQEIENEISYIEDHIQMLKEDLEKLANADVIGSSVSHRKFGEGKITGQTDDKVTVEFPAGSKIMSLAFLTSNHMLDDTGIAQSYNNRLQLKNELDSYRANLAIKNSELAYFIQKNKTRKQLQEEEEERERISLEKRKKKAEQ
jgi:hypothetical protein